jgi:hypothetical protein
LCKQLWIANLWYHPDIKRRGGQINVKMAARPGEENVATL